MPEQGRSRKILQTLSERLPEKVLQELLPEIETETVRDLLTHLAGQFPPGDTLQQQTRHSSTSSSQTDRFCTLYTDGASRGNPGEAGAGAVLLSADGEELGKRSFYLGQCTNNVAEYLALIAGLELAEQLNCRYLQICLDSELIVRQVQGSYKVKNQQLQPLFEKVQVHLAKLQEWEIRHIPRQENARADELANMGIENRENVRL